MTGIELIDAERRRQIMVEGWTAEHDRSHWDGALAQAAICYALRGDIVIAGKGFRFKLSRTHAWPWDRRWWKPCPNDRVKELVKAGALIAAEIDRIQKEKPS